MTTAKIGEFVQYCAGYLPNGEDLIICPALSLGYDKFVVTFESWDQLLTFNIYPSIEQGLSIPVDYAGSIPGTKIKVDESRVDQKQLLTFLRLMNPAVIMKSQPIRDYSQLQELSKQEHDFIDLLVLIMPAQIVLTGTYSETPQPGTWRYIPS